MGTLARTAARGVRARLSVIVWAASLTFGVAACGCGKKDVVVLKTTPAEIVQQQTVDGLTAFFAKAGDGDALRAFVTAIKAAKGRDDLRAAWAAQPSLAAKKADFLDKNVFAHAEKEAKWPKAPDPEASLAAIEAASVEGVRSGVESFLK